MPKLNKMNNKKCKHCNEEIHDRKANAKYCNEYCYNMYVFEHQPKKKVYGVGQCIVCNEEFNKRNDNHVFCSAKCTRYKRSNLGLTKPINREYF